MKLRALIVDDEPLAQNIIEQYAAKLPDLEIAGKCNDAICAHKFIEQNEIDLIFLDINMPKLSGIAFLKTLKNPPIIIFTTAYSEYALEGFELNAIDYLKKPFSFDRFCKAYFKADELIRLKRGNRREDSKNAVPDFLFVKTNRRMVKIKFTDILFIEGLGDYIKFHLKNSRIITNLTMKKVHDLLPGKDFYRIHKSFIISLDKIDSLEGNMTIINGIKIPIGNSYRQEFIKIMKNYFANS